MYSIHNQFKSFNRNSNYSLFLFNKYSLNTKEDYIFISGLLNFLWQSWNRFWRIFWLTYLSGGLDYRRNHISRIPQFQGKTENEILYYILYILGKRNNPTGSIVASYQEPTWGDIDTIINLANRLCFPGESIELIRINVLSSFSVLGDTPKHFQTVRNASVHLDIDNINKVISTVIPYYTVSQINYPTEILFANDLRSNKIAYQQWLDDLCAVLTLIYI